MNDKTLNEVRALALAVYRHINQPYKLGRVWATYSADTVIDAHRDSHRLLELLGFKFGEATNDTNNK